MTSQTPILTGDDLLTMLAGINRENWFLALAGRGTRILREAADLCGVDAEGMGRKSLINAIIANF